MMRPAPATPRATRHAARGFTLIEVLVALLLLGLAAAAFASLQAGALRASRLAHTKRLAAHHLSNELTAQRLMVAGASTAPGGCFTEPPAGYTCEARRLCVPEHAACALITAHVTITPREGEAVRGATASFRPLLVAP